MEETISQKLRISNDAEFMKTLKQRINDTFDGCPSKDNTQIYIKTFVILLWYVASLAILFTTESNTLRILMVLSFAFASAGVGFNILHDAIHGSYSVNKKVNQFFSFVSSSLIGPGHHFWRHKHNFLHHQYCNIQNWDDDLETRDGLRLGPDQPWSIRYKYQHIYAPIMYGLTTLEWFFFKDYYQYFTLKMNQWQKIPKMKTKDHFEFWSARALYYGITIALPLTVFSFSQFIVGFLLFHFTMSVTIASIFQLAHVMEETDYPSINQQTQKLDRNWVELQLSTTVNFATNNKFLNWYTGGLNHQVEHHILPNISHIHYPEISKILRQTAHEFGYPYLELKTYGEALRSHFNTLKKHGYYGQAEYKTSLQTQ